MVDYYIAQSKANNHGVREAACACIAELVEKVGTCRVGTCRMGMWFMARVCGMWFVVCGMWFMARVLCQDRGKVVRIHSQACVEGWHME